MINILDIRTLFISYSISNAICAVVMAILWLQNRGRFAGIGFWFANFIMQFVSILLIAIRGLVPDFISIILANTIAVAGLILLYSGLQKFVNKAGSPRYNYILLVVFFIVHTYFTYLQPSLAARSLNISLALLLVCIQAAWLMLHRTDASFRSDESRTGFIFAAFGLVNIVRILFESKFLTTNDLLTSGIFEALVILVYQMLNIGLTFALFLMVNHRLVARLEHDIIESNHAENIQQARLRIIDFATEHSLDELLQNALDELCALTESPIGFFHFVESDQRTLSLRAWSTRTLNEMCTAEGKGSHYNIDQAGVWVDCVREKRPVIHNDYASLPHRRGLPQGHAPIIREMVFPIMRNQKIVAIIGVGNKSVDYSEADVSVAMRLADLIWDITKRKKTELDLQENYSTLHNILESTDALIFSVNRQYCYISFNSAYAAKMKQLYNQEIQIGGNLLEYLTVEVDRIIAKQSIDRSLAGDHIVEESLSGEEGLARLYFEVSHAPILTDTGEIIGVSIFARDITRRKQIELSLQQRLVELETVNKLSVSVRLGQNLEELLYILLSETLKAVHAADGCILLLDPVDNNLKIAGSRGWYDSKDGPLLDTHDGIVGYVFANNEPYIFPDIHNHKLITDQTCDLIPPRSSGAFLPLRGEMGVIGVLIVSFSLPRIVSENEVRLLTIISQLGANAVLRSRLHDQIQLFNINLQKEIHQKVVAQELLAAEKELLTTTLMSIADGVIVTDKDGLVILFNRAAEAITGYSVSEAIKKPINTVFKLHISSTLKLVSDVINYLFELEMEQKKNKGYRSPLLTTKNGERIVVSGSITSLKSSDENTAGFVIVFQNINEKQMVEAQNMLSQKMEAIGQLAAGIAHEINTPIQYIGDNIKFLSKAYSKYSDTLAAYQQVIQAHLERPFMQDDLTQLDELACQKKVSYYAKEIPNAVQESLDGIERVRKIVLAMREFSHPSEKEKKLSDINHGIETTVVISRNEWKYCADLKTNLDKELPLVYCQIDEINQVVLNMIVNAAQAIQEKLPAGADQKGEIRINTGKCEDRVFITIQDTGPGIPLEIRSRIFDPFFTTKGVGKGTGQGLSMAHNIIVKKHHGIISVDSAPGQGSTFTIELPIESSELEQ